MKDNKKRIIHKNAFSGKVTTSDQKKIKAAANDFAVRFEKVMRDLANG